MTTNFYVNGLHEPVHWSGVDLLPIDCHTLMSVVSALGCLQTCLKADVGLGEFFPQLWYKYIWRGVRLLAVAS